MKHIIKKPVAAAAKRKKMASSSVASCNECTMLTWSPPVQIASTFATLFEMQQTRHRLKMDVEKKERDLASAKRRLHILERTLEDERQRNQSGCEPTGRVLNVFSSSVASEVHTCCRFLSGEVALNTRLPGDAVVGDLQTCVHRELGWMFLQCLDDRSDSVPKHAKLTGYPEIVMKEIGIPKEDAAEFESESEPESCSTGVAARPSDLEQKRRKQQAADFLKEHTCPVQYIQKEQWKDDVANGEFVGKGDFMLNFQTSRSAEVLNFNELIDLQTEGSRQRCEELIRAECNVGRKRPYGCLAPNGHENIKSRGPSQVEIVRQESRLNEILTSLSEEAEAFASADWRDSPDEVQCCMNGSKHVLKMALAWIEQFCTSASTSAVYVRREHGKRTYSAEPPEWGHDDDSPGTFVLKVVGVLFLRAESGDLARLSLEKNIVDFAGAHDAAH